MRRIISILMIIVALITALALLPIFAEETPGGETNSGTEQTQGSESSSESATTETQAPDVDFSELEILLYKVDSLNRKDWHSRLFLYLTFAADEGRELLTKEGVTQADVNRKVREIQRKYDALQVKPPLIPLDEMTLEEYEEWIENGAFLDDGDREKMTMRPKETAPIPANLVTKSPDADADKGCSGLIGGAALVLFAVAGIGACVALTKKED